MKRGRLAGTLGALALLAAPAGASAVAGDVYVADQSAGPDGTGAIFRLDLASGAPTPLVAGPPLENPGDMVFDRDGQLVVADDAAAAIFRVDPATGQITEVARGGELADPWGVAFGPADRLFVTDIGFESARRNRLPHQRHRQPGGEDPVRGGPTAGRPGRDRP